MAKTRGANGAAPHDSGGLARFDEIRDALEPLLAKLWAASSATRGSHRDIPRTPGIYLFTEGGKPMYVGQTRNIKRRLADHARPSGGHNQASFAFLLAKAEVKKRRLTVTGKRAVVAVHAEFVPLFVAAKKQVAEMEVRFIEERDAYLRTVFEVYAALALGTGEYNSFETH